ncbi:ABC transporter permease [Chitinophaga polysaccharea]|uniref:ABC transporter permease n=1 Tax=Chitinophaga polysaccharea TaxID=1293035 RepID=UPI001157CCF1|nr:ABC transporter permease [Chitinophaga polysaccharea]
MIANYFNIAFRHFRRNRGYSILNIAGLTAGIVCTALICLWIESELTFNHDIPGYEHLYIVRENQTHDGKISTYMGTPGPMGKALPQDVSGVVRAARSGGNSRELFSWKDKHMNIDGHYTDASLFAMLGLQFTGGNPATAFQQVNSLVISERMATAFFGTTDAVGKTLTVNNGDDYMITGVFKALPENSTFNFQWLAPFEVIEASHDWIKRWDANGVRTYVQLSPHADVAAVNQQLKTYLSTKTRTNTVCFLQAMDDWNLYDQYTDGRVSGGRIQYVRLFSIIAGIILLIACINFMNLATAGAEKRAREVGVRKVMGAGRDKLLLQFMTESVTMAFIAVILAVLILLLVLPVFNAVIGKQLSLSLWKPSHTGALLLIGLLTGAVAGSYPAFYLSSFSLVGVLKKMKGSGNVLAGFIRRGLVVTQFSVSIILIICTIIVYQQINHVKSRNLGFDKDRLLSVNMQGHVRDHFEAILHDLQETGMVANAALSQSPMLKIWYNADNYTWNGKDPEKNVLITYDGVSPQYLNTMSMQLLAGRDFNTDARTDSNNVIINHSMAVSMGAEGRVGGIIYNNNRAYHIVGVIGDFLYNNMYTASAPFLLFSNTAYTEYISIRFKPEANINTALAATEKIFARYNPGYPFEYTFTDTEFAALFREEMLTGRLVAFFAGLAIFISCLGLFGLATYTAERRTREIGIRKVLGASIAGLTGLLSREYMKLVGISCLLAFPVAWWMMHRWLQAYEYRIAISGWIFMFAGLLAMAIALATVSYQALKAALANPVKSLRAE